MQRLDIIRRDQETPRTCAQAILVMAGQGYQQELSEQQCTSWLNKFVGTPPSIFKSTFRKLFPNLEIEDSQIPNEIELRQLIEMQLAEGHPVPALITTSFLNEHQELFEVLHYVLITGLDGETVSVADPNPTDDLRINHLTIRELLERMSLSRYQYTAPRLHKVAMNLGIIKPYTVFRVKGTLS